MNRYVIIIFFLLTIVGLPLLFMFIVEPVYAKLPAWMFLFFFVVALPVAAGIIAQLVSNRAVGFRGGLRTAVRHRGYFNLTYYLVLCGLGLIVVYALGGFT